MKTEILAIIDMSGSMQGIKAEAIGGFNAFLKDQKAVPGAGRMTLALFDHEYNCQYEGMPLSDAAPLNGTTYEPRGTTALYDAIGRTLDEQGKRIAAEGWAEKVIVCILTDGHENASKDYTQARIKEMTAHAEKAGWSFVFLAANQDAFTGATSLGINACSMSNATVGFSASSAGTMGAYDTMSLNATNLRSGKATVSK